MNHLKDCFFILQIKPSFGKIIKCKIVVFLPDSFWTNPQFRVKIHGECSAKNGTKNMLLSLLQKPDKRNRRQVQNLHIGYSVFEVNITQYSVYYYGYVMHTVDMDGSWSCQSKWNSNQTKLSVDHSFEPFWASRGFFSSKLRLFSSESFATQHLIHHNTIIIH